MVEEVTLDFLILANHVESINGLLYISGGGWTDHHRAITESGPIPNSHFGIAASITVPWTQTNVPHILTIQIEDDDSNTLISKIDAQLTVGRPPQLSQGSSQPVMIGLSQDVQFPKPGGYRLLAKLDGESQSKRWPFRVIDVPVLRPAAMQGFEK